MTRLSYITTFWYLLKAELEVFKKDFWGKVIDTAIWVAITIFVTSYIMPALGVPADYGLLIISGLLASAGLMEVYPNAMGLAADLQGPRTISYELTLPIASWLIPLKKVAYFTLSALSIGLFVLPIGKILLYNQFDFSTISWPKLCLVFLLTNIFSGVFALFVGTTVKNIATDHTWMRFVFPFWQGYSKPIPL